METGVTTAKSYDPVVTNVNAEAKLEMEMEKSSQGSANEVYKAHAWLTWACPMRRAGRSAPQRAVWAPEPRQALGALPLVLRHARHRQAGTTPMNTGQQCLQAWW